MLEKKGKKLKLIKISNTKIRRRQEAPKCFDMTTVCYVFKPNYIMKTKDVLSGKVGFINIPKERSIDIDDKIDYKIASILAKKKDE
jgi:CMP-N-acetylneuraminic acid synthetase